MPLQRVVLDTRYAVKQSRESRAFTLMAVVTAAIGIGAVAAVFATRLLRSLLFLVHPLDLGVLAPAVASVFMLVLVASVIPARRAASIELAQALRNG